MIEMSGNPNPPAVTLPAFTVRVRSGGGKGTSMLITIPRDIVALLSIEKGDWVKLAIEEVFKKK